SARSSSASRRGRTRSRLRTRPAPAIAAACRRARRDLRPVERADVSPRRRLQVPTWPHANGSAPGRTTALPLCVTACEICSMETAHAPGWRIAIDRGGTFTDIVAWDPAGRLHVCKVLSQDSQDATDPAVRGIDRLLRTAVE